MVKESRLEELKQTFRRHAEESWKRQMEIEIAFMENNPDEPFPDYMKDPFNLPASLAFLCQYLQDLSREVRNGK